VGTRIPDEERDVSGLEERFSAAENAKLGRLYASTSAAIALEWIAERLDDPATIEAVTAAVRRGAFDVRSVNRSRNDMRALAAITAVKTALGATS